MAFWSGEKIQEVAELHPRFISEFDDKQVDCNAYTMRVGNEYFVTADSLSPSTITQSRKMQLTAKQSFVIPPGQFALLITRESIEVPMDAMAFISMKFTYKFRELYA